jgi:hypothetical protein
MFFNNHRFQVLRENSKSKSHSGYFEKIRIEEPWVFLINFRVKEPPVNSGIFNNHEF